MHRSRALVVVALLLASSAIGMVSARRTRTADPPDAPPSTGPPGGDCTDADCRDGPGGIAARLETDGTRHRPGEPIRLRLVVTNHADHAVRFRTGLCGDPAGFRAVRDDRTVWRSGDGGPCPAGVVAKTLPAGASRTYTATWKAPAVEGTYHLTGTFEAEPVEVEAHATVHVRAKTPCLPGHCAGDADGGRPTDPPTRCAERPMDGSRTVEIVDAGSLQEVARPVDRPGRCRDRDERLVVRVETDRRVYDPGDTARLELTVTNRGDRPVGFRAGCSLGPAAFQVDRAGRRIWYPRLDDRPRVYCMHMAFRTLDPGESATFTDRWEVADGPGRYRVVGLFTTYRTDPVTVVRDETPIRVEGHPCVPEICDDTSGDGSPTDPEDTGDGDVPTDP